MDMTVKGWRKGDDADVRDTIVALLSTGGAAGWTVDDIAQAIHDPQASWLQDSLEDLVDEGVLDRHGIGRGAMYTRALPGHAPSPAASPQNHRADAAG